MCFTCGQRHTDDTQINKSLLAPQHLNQRSEHDSGQVANALSSTVKDKHSDKQENVITLQAHCAAHCCAGASESDL